MPDPAITLEGVAKRYELGALTGSLAERLNTQAHRLLHRGRLAPSDHHDDFWALRGVSLEIAQGEVVGLIGRNGAGKSTLMKLLARITYPTEGIIRTRGRVGTLLEVGTGFHPELSGRENVYLSGTILGMTRREIHERFEAIVEFSGIERFIDTPVKRYSSGMYVRLGFAVAVHMSPDVLLVDEVLAVGDAEFQQKCLGKMREVVAEGRTIVFVTHNLTSVHQLCDRSYWIDHGGVAREGATDEVIAAYLQEVGAEQHGGVATVDADAARIGTGEARLRRLEMLDDRGRPIDRITLGQRFSFVMTFEVETGVDDVAVSLGISSADGAGLVTVHNTDSGHGTYALAPGISTVQVDLEVTLLPGDFSVEIGLHTLGGFTLDYVERVFTFTSLNLAEHPGARHPWRTVRGPVRVPSTWSLAPRLGPER